MDGDNIRFGRGLYALRTQAELTQEQLAERLGCVPSYISRFERGAFERPSYQTMEDMARAFGLPDASTLVRCLRREYMHLTNEQQHETQLAASG